MPSREATELLGASDAVAARILDGVLSGLHDDLAGLVVCNDSMANLRVYYVLNLLAERGRIRYPIHLLDTPRGGGRYRNRFVARQYERLAGFVSSCTGRSLDAASLVDAATQEAPLASALERVRKRRVEGTLSGSAALGCYTAALQTAPFQALTGIEGVLNRLDAALETAPGDAITVFMTGSSHPDSTVYEALEGSGIVVVGEDHDAGDGAWIGASVTTASPETAFYALAELHARRPPSASRSLSAERTRHLLGEVHRTRATGVVALVRDLDDGPAWDLPDHREALSGSGTWSAGIVQISADGILAATAKLVSTIQSTAGNAQ